MMTLAKQPAHPEPGAAGIVIARHIRAAGLLGVCCLALLAGFGSAPATAADCPKDLWSAGKLRLTYADGMKMTIESLDANTVKRIEPLNQAGVTNHILSYKRLFPERVVAMRGNTKLATQMNNLAPGDREWPERFWPIKAGATLTLNYDSVVDTGAPSQPAPPNQKTTTTTTVRGQGDHDVGSCRYRVFNILVESKNCDGTQTSRVDLMFAPELATPLKASGILKNAGKADFTLERAVIGISIVSPTDPDR